MEQLNAPQAVISRFRELHEADIQPLKAIYVPNERGQSMLPVPWIWKVNILEGTDSEYLNERKCSYVPAALQALNVFKYIESTG